MAGDDFSPIMQGDTGNPLIGQFLHMDGSPMSLAGATLSMKLQLIEALSPLGVVGIIKDCNGTFTIDDAPNGKWHYQYQATDVDTPGKWHMYPKATISGQSITGDDGRGRPKTLVIQPSP